MVVILFWNKILKSNLHNLKKNEYLYKNKMHALLQADNDFETSTYNHYKS